MNRRISRYVVYPIISAIRREPASALARDFARTQWLRPEALQALQLGKLKAIVAHAYAHVPFYRDHFRNCGVDPASLRRVEDLGQLPVLEKADLAALRQALGFTSGPRDTRMTAGSSGTPTIVYADRRTNAHSLAARYRCLEWYGVGVGDRQARFWGRPPDTFRRKERLKDLALNRVRINSTQLVPDTLPRLVDQLRRFRPDFAYGYPSLMLMLLDRIEALSGRGHGLRLKLVVSTSETSLPSQRARLGASFGCPCVSEYGCSETDIISFECPHGGNHVMAENVLVEILPAADVPPGVGEVVVTDLNNRAMPLIRYRLGDLASLDSRECPCGRGLPLMSDVVGRKLGQYVQTPIGRMVYASSFAYMFEELVSSSVPIRQYRIIQESMDRLLILVAAPQASAGQRAAVERLVSSEVGSLTSDSVACRFEFVDEIPRPLADGKFFVFESRIQPGNTLQGS